MRNRDVLVIGSHVYGVYVGCRTLPRPGETVTGHGFEAEVADDGGKGSNQALCAGRLGARTTFQGVTGSEAVVERAMAHLAETGVDTSFVRRSTSARSGVSVSIVDDAGLPMIVTDPGANAELDFSDLDRAPFASHSFTLLQFESPVDVVIEAARRANRAGSRALLTPGPYVATAPGALAGIDILAPNETEAAALLGQSDLGDDDASVARAIADRCGVSNVVLTRGARGCTLLWDHAIHRIAPFSVTARNTIGAGDGFVAALATALALSFPIEAAGKIAAATAAIAVSRPGAPWASYPTAAEVSAFLAQNGENGLADLLARAPTQS